MRLEKVAEYIEKGGDFPLNWGKSIAFSLKNLDKPKSGTDVISFFYCFDEHLFRADAKGIVSVEGAIDNKRDFGFGMNGHANDLIVLSLVVPINSRSDLFHF